MENEAKNEAGEEGGAVNAPASSGHGMSDLVLTEQRDHVRLLTFNRVEKRNAFDNAMYRATTAALQAALDDPSVRVVVLTGAGEKGEANAKRVMAANAEKTGPNAPKPGEGPSKEERENGLYDLLYVAIAPDGRQVRAAVKGDRDPGYGSTSKMISECAICLLRDAPDVSAGFWTPGAAMGNKLIKRLEEHAGLTFRAEK